MCGMFFTLNEEYIPRLSEENAKRGGVNKSITKIEPFCDVTAWVGHFQAPTSVVSRTHPHVISEESTSMLWHNGILKESEIAKLRKLYDPTEEWDTALLHKHILEAQVLDDVDGSFAVMFNMNIANHDFFFFARNALVPLYTNEQHDILSSVKIKDLGVTELIEAGTWYGFDENDFFKINCTGRFRKFKTLNNPYDI